MVGLLFHVLYLFGKCIYDRYYVRKTRYLPDTSDETELFTPDYDTFDDVAELENTSWWTHQTINNFFPPAYIQRYCAVSDVLNEYKGKMHKVVDFGCAELGFLVYMKGMSEVQEILCVDVDKVVLERNEKKAAPLITEMLSTRDRKLTIEICEGSVTDNDVKLKHVNAVICIELIEHLYPDTLIDLPFNIFGYIKPEVAIITTPNVEFNVVFPHLSGYRHPDHKFEWTKKQFQDWAHNIVERYPYYNVTFHGICDGPEGTEELGALTQMAVFHRILPRDRSRIEILIPDEYIQLRGQPDLFNTVAKYNYSAGNDPRTDEQKVLDDAIYYINFLSCNISNEDVSRNDEIRLDRILHFMTKYTLTLETLRSILTDAGWNIEDREDGPVLLIPSEHSSEMSDDSYLNMEIENDDWINEYENSFEENASINQVNTWDYVPNSPINELPADEDWNEESNVTNEDNRLDDVTNSSTNEISADINAEYVSQRNAHTESWHEESNVTNEENRLDYVTNSSVNDIPASEDYLSEQNLHTESWHDSPNFTNEEDRWDYVTHSPTNEVSADINVEYVSQQNAHIESWREEPNVTNEENRLDYVTNSSVNDIPTNEEYLSEQNLHTESLHDDPNFTNEEDRWDYESSLVVNEIPVDTSEYLSVQDPHIENWHEESSIIIPENCSINQENTYLFDGENSLVEEFQPSENPYEIHNNIKHSGIKSTVESLTYTERELPSDSIPLTLNEIEVEAQETAFNISSMACNNSSQLKNSTDNITVESALQNDQKDLSTAQGVTSTLNFQSCNRPVSRSSTSPVSLYFNSEQNISLQDFSTYQNESSINDQCLLNTTFHQSEATEEAMNRQESIAEDVLCFEGSLPEKDAQESEISFSLHVRLSNCHVEGSDISDKNQSEDSDVADMMSPDVYSNILNNQPKYTSSPHAKIPATNIVKKSSKNRELISAMNSNVLLGTTDEIKEIVSDTSDINLLEASQKSNSIAETIKLQATPLNSDITNTSRYNVDPSASNITQQTCLENKKCSDVGNSVSTKLIPNTNQEIAKNDVINHKSDDIQNIDAHHVLPLLGNKSSNHKDKNVYCTLTKTDHIDAKTHLENAISELSQSRKKGLNPPRELLSSKSQSISKHSSSDCAKETSVLRNDRFVPCKSNEDTSNVHFTSVLKSEEIVSTSKDVSNVAGLASNVEAKPSSPLETPPSSWSPEIMDSGYPNSTSAQDITPEYDLSSIAQDHIPDSESPSIAEAPRVGVLEPVEVENGDLANNNRDDEGNNMMAVDANDIENLQPFIDVLENDLENENDIYIMQNGFPIWLLRILDMANPLDFEMQAQQDLRIPDEVADDANYVGHDEGFDSSSESESDVAYNEMENDNGHEK